jgi:hypothetical protein
LKTAALEMGRQIDRILRGPESASTESSSAEPSPGDSSLGVGLGRLVGCTLVCGAIYGAAMGSFGGTVGERAVQIAISASKVPLLLFVTFGLSLPSFFVLNNLFGVRGDFGLVMRALVGSQAGLTIVLASLTPYTLLWYASCPDYGWALLANGLAFAIASFSGQVLLRAWYRPLLARSTRHRWLLRAWLVVYVFVGVQMAWTLRPFVGEPGAPPQMFRTGAWGNAYEAVARIVWDTLTR